MKHPLGLSKEVLEMAIKAEPAIARAEKILEQLGSFEEIKRYYEAREIAIHDEVTRITGARAEGQLERSIQIARSLLDILDDRTISEKTGIPLEDVVKMRQQ